MKKLLTLLVICLLQVTYAQIVENENFSVVDYSNQKYSKVKIFTDGFGLQQLAELGVAVDHGQYKKNTFFISDFSEYEIQIMQDNGFSYEILIDDVQSYYVNQNGSADPKNATCSGSSGGGYTAPTVPANFYMNSGYGGFLKYQDMLDALDAMVAQYPALITVKAPISSFLTHENRVIYHVKISDDPNNDDATEPNVLYTAIHHAREPMSMSQTIFYMWYLLENYATSEEIQFLVDNTEMYFVPCLNPDGYIKNEVDDPNGGGMHRKNLAPVGSWNPGVDLNRNYSYGWGTTGISWNQNNDTYPGDAAFSEPETQAMQWLQETYGFVSAFNAHSYGDQLLHPVGTTSAEFADHHDYFTDLTDHMVMHNGFENMKSSGLYPASGDSDDYEYKVDIGVGLKDTVFAMTPEVGPDFWPPSTAIVPSCQDMIHPNLVLSHMAHRYLLVDEIDPNTVSVMSGNFNHEVMRLGLEDGAVNVSIEPLLNIQTVGGPVSYDLAVREVSSGSISFTLNPAISFGDEIHYVLNTDYPNWTHRDTIIKTYGALNLQHFEDASSNSNWIGNWNITSAEFYSPSESFTDSPGGNYGNDVTRTYEFDQDIDLTTATAAGITYYAKWDIEEDYDYCQFQVSVDGGSSWIGQCTNYTVEGTSANGSVQPNNLPVYESVQSTWVLDEVSLSDYLGQVVRVRFILESDGGQTEDGFYFDDFSVLYNDASGPVTPTANFNTTTTSICEGESITFSDVSIGIPDSWDWDFGDTGTSTDQSPAHIYSTAGVYTVSLTVTNAAGNDTYTMVDYITVGAPTTNDQVITICEGETLTVGSSNYTTAGSYTDVLVNAAGCDSTVTTTLSIDPTPVTTLVSSDPNDSLCIYNSPITLTGSPMGGTYTGWGVTGDQFDPSASGNGTHTLTYSYTDPSNGCVGTTQISINVQSCVGLIENLLEGVLLYPNPSSGLFHIRGLELGSAFDIFDVAGKLVYQGKINEVNQLVDVRNLSKGKYYLKSVVNEIEGQISFVID